MIRHTTTALATALALLLLAAPAVTHAGEGGFCVEVLIDSGNTCQHGTYHGTIVQVDGRSTGTATAAVWVANSNRDRISRRGDCYQAGCTASIGSWPFGPDSWAGFSAVHNRGTFISRYRGYFWFW